MGQPSTFALFFDQVGIFIVLVFLVMVAWNLWLNYIVTAYLRTIEWVMLEIVPPKDVFKSPEAMELVLNSLYAGDATNWFVKYWKGEVGQCFSLEIASIEGQVHFFVRFAKKFRKGFESQLYAQYPQAEVREVEDYTKNIPDYVKGGAISLFGYELGLKKADSYPIKSYIDFGLDRAIGSLDEEQRIDPITPILETMGSIGIGEQMWFQIIMQKDTKRHDIKNKDKVTGKEKIEKGTWKDSGKAEIEKLRLELNPVDKETGKVTPIRPTKAQSAIVESIERHRNKLGFDCGGRVIYLADKDHFDANMIGAFTGMFRHFSSEDLNSFSLNNLTKSPDEPWKDIGKRKAEKKKVYILDDYKNRTWFYGSFNFKKLKKYFTNPVASGSKPFVLSTEELATIYHLPGRVAETPTFTRIESKKGEPPANLPI